MTEVVDAPMATAAGASVPLISVLMPVYGRCELAVAALASLAAHTPCPYEVIVVDNASPDGAAEIIEAAVPGVNLIRAPLNMGFGPAIDLAAMHARGELLLLLNSDVVLQQGWLAPLLEVLDRHPSIAAVSPALCDVDGEVYEVGSALLRGGETVPIPIDGEWDFARPRVVPYVSAACLLIRRQAFNTLGGVDAVYVRGYYEDVELALDLRSRGLHVACDPRSKVMHHRGASTSRRHAEALWGLNRGVFCERWASKITSLPPSGAKAPART